VSQIEIIKKSANAINLLSFRIEMTSKNFNIKETVHKNIEKNQFPSFSNHRSLVGWCTMNYPKVLVNPIYLQK
jgi:F-box/leucine-rich repeat protein 2/20